MTLQQYEPPMVIDSTSAHQINQALAYINGIGSTLGPFLKNDILKGSMLHAQYRNSNKFL